MKSITFLCCKFSFTKYCNDEEDMPAACKISQHFWLVVLYVPLLVVQQAFYSDAVLQHANVNLFVPKT